jgi:hypothetical protein
MRFRMPALFVVLLASGVAMAPRVAGAQLREHAHRVELEEHESEEGVPRGGMGFLAIGTHQLDLDDLNGALLPFGFLPFRDRALSLGGAGWGIRGRWMIGGEGQGLIVPSRESGGLQTRLNIGYGLFDVGYRIVATDALDVFPMLGVGGGGILVDITPRGAFNFDDVLADPGRGSRLRGASFALSTSIGVVVKARGRRTRHGEGGLAIGARAGYVFATDPDEWKLNEEGDVAGVPEVSFSGPFAGLMLGGWGRR